MDKEEKIFYAHWFSVIPYFIFGLGIAFMVAISDLNNIDGNFPFMLFGLIPILIGFINYLTTKITIDPNCVHFTKGLINIQIKEYSLNNIESIAIN